MFALNSKSTYWMIWTILKVWLEFVFQTKCGKKSGVQWNDQVIDLHWGICFDLTHWGRVMQIYFGNLTLIGSDNSLASGRCQAIIWTKAVILLIGPLRTNFNKILKKILQFSCKKIHLNVSSEKWRQFCLSLNVLTCWKGLEMPYGDMNLDQHWFR